MLIKLQNITLHQSAQRSSDLLFTNRNSPNPSSPLNPTPQAYISYTQSTSLPTSSTSPSRRNPQTPFQTLSQPPYEQKNHIYPLTPSSLCLPPTTIPSPPTPLHPNPPFSPHHHSPPQSTSTPNLLLLLLPQQKQLLQLNCRRRPPKKKKKRKCPSNSSSSQSRSQCCMSISS